jgi:alpha-tubulin suppressor-like RCC1 family protein
VIVGDLKFSQIVAGVSHSCGLTTEGTAYCWGYNFWGQLGDGTLTDRSLPVPVSGSLKFAAISVGSEHTCAVAVGGSAYCWGSAFNGRLGVDPSAVGACPNGQSTFPCSVQPIAVQGGLGFTSISANAATTCALTAAGAAYCWGGNSDGQLGDGTFTNRSAPTRVVR